MHKFTQVLLLLCVMKTVPCKSDHAAIAQLKHNSKHKVIKVDISDISYGNYGALFPELGRTKILSGKITEINEIYFDLRNSSQSMDPGTPWPRNPIYSIIENNAYYIVSKLNRPATIAISQVDGIDIPEDPASEGLFKIEKYSDFEFFQKDFILSLSESKKIHHAWIDEQIKVVGKMQSDEWTIYRLHLNHKHKRTRYSVERVPLVDRNTGDIYVKFILSK